MPLFQRFIWRFRIIQRSQQHLSYINFPQLHFSPVCQMEVGVMRTLSRSRPPSWQTLALSHPLSPFTGQTLSVSPNGRIHVSQARCSTLLSLPTSSLVAPAKTFEVFEQQGNTFAFHLTCLWRPLKYIIAEQHRSPSHPP